MVSAGGETKPLHGLIQHLLPFPIRSTEPLDEGRIQLPVAPTLTIDLDPSSRCDALGNGSGGCCRLSTLKF